MPIQLSLERALARHPLILSLLLNGLFFALTYTLCVPRYQSNDDVAMTLMAAGVTMAVEPTPHILFSNILLGKFLNLLYGLNLYIPWYALLQILVLFASHASFLYIALKGSPRSLSGLPDPNRVSR